MWLFFLLVSIDTKAQNGIVAEADITETTFLRDLEFQPFFTFGYKKKVASGEGVSSDGEGCGYCSESTNYFPSEIKMYNGAGLNINYSKNRLYLIFTAAYEKYKGDVSRTFRRSFYHPHLPFGTITDYYEENDYQSFVNQRLLFGFGIGGKLFHPESWYNIIPRIKLSSSFIHRLTTEKNYYTKHRVYYWDQNPEPSDNYEWDSTFYPSRITVNSEVFDLSVGFVFTARPIKNLVINIDLSYSLINGGIVNIPSSLTMRFKNSIGVGYILPLADKPKPPAVVRE